MPGDRKLTARSRRRVSGSLGKTVTGRRPLRPSSAWRPTRASSQARPQIASILRTSLRGFHIAWRLGTRRPPQRTGAASCSLEEVCRYSGPDWVSLQFQRRGVSLPRPTWRALFVWFCAGQKKTPPVQRGEVCEVFVGKQTQTDYQGSGGPWEPRNLPTRLSSVRSFAATPGPRRSRPGTQRRAPLFSLTSTPA